MSGLKEQKCPGCGAAMRYDPELGKMICDYCGTVLAIQPVKPGSAAAQAAGVERIPPRDAFALERGLVQRRQQSRDEDVRAVPLRDEQSVCAAHAEPGADRRLEVLRVHVDGRRDDHGIDA